MAESSTTQEKKANVAVKQGDHDRVAMLSLHPDGSPAQFEPEIIGDKEFAVEAAKRQFAEQAVSAADVAERGVSTGGPVTLVGQPDGSVKSEPARSDPDPGIAELKEKHDSAQSAGESAAEKVVGALFKD